MIKRGKRIRGLRVRERSEHRKTTGSHWMGGAGIRVGGGQWKYVRGKRQKPPGGAQALWGTPAGQEVRALRGGGLREEVAEVGRATAARASGGGGAMTRHPMGYPRGADDIR